MNRRRFLAAGAVTGAAVTTLIGSASASAGTDPQASKSFKLKYAPHFGMFKHHAGGDPINQLKFAADAGFSAWEDNGMMSKAAGLQEKIAKTMQDLKMTMGVFVAYSGFGKTEMVTKTSKEYQDYLRSSMKKAVECAKRVNAKWCTVVPASVNMKIEYDYMMANCIENLKVMAEVCEPSGLVMVLEPLNWWANHPGLFLREIPQAYLICKSVGSPSCQILDDLYHQQISEGNLIANMDKAWDQIAYIQVGDNPGRKEPTTGEINYKNIFKYLYDKGFTGVVGMEHGNSQKGKEGELALIKAYRAVDDFQI
ncbi:MAG: TIM barrel protein [Planctomycetota bacterium]